MRNIQVGGNRPSDPTHRNYMKRESDSLSRYLQEIEQYELLSHKEEKHLADRIESGDKEALDTLVQANLRFVVSVAKQYQGQRLSLSDLISLGNEGLIKAAKRFDASRGFKFISFAVWWIRREIIEGLSTDGYLVRLPRNKFKMASKMNKFAQKFCQKHEREPTPQELLKEVTIDQDDYKEVVGAYRGHSSLDAPIFHDEVTTHADLLADERAQLDIESKLEKESFHREIYEALDELPQKDKEIVERKRGLNGYEPHSTTAIMDIMGLTRSRVNQIVRRSPGKIRETEKGEQLRKYL